MDRRIDIDLIIWLVFLLLLFGGTLIRWIINRFGRRKEEEAAPQGETPTFMEEFKKLLQGMVLEERPEIVIVEERPHKKRAKPVKVRAPRGFPPIHKEGEKPAAEGKILAREVATVQEVSAPPVSFIQILPKDELQKTIVLSEVLGPPRARRRHYRLF